MNAQLEPEYDLLIVGSGAASVCAAMVAQEQGESVAILEKQSKFGGSTGYSGGVLWVPNNPLLSSHGVEDSYERGRRYFDAVVPDEGPATSPARREVFLKAGPAAIQFLIDRGLDLYYADGWSDYYDDRPGGEPRGRSIMAKPFNLKELGEWRDRVSQYLPFSKLPVNASDAASIMMVLRTWKGKLAALNFVFAHIFSLLRGHRRVVNGGALQGRLLKLALSRNLQIFLDSPVSSIVEEHGRVTGVVVDQNGEEKFVKARKGVLLNSGGFARNESMRKKYQRSPVASSNANPGDTGEIIEFASTLGAATAAMDSGIWVPTSRHTDGSWPKDAIGEDGVVYPFMHNHDIAAPFSMIVDQTGRRYFNECSSYMELGESMYSRQQENNRAIPSWIIMEARNRKRYGFALTPPGIVNKEWIESGYMKKADTLEELAEKCGIDGAGLKATVERFNEFCETGEDEDFARGKRQYDRWRGDPTQPLNPNLGPLEKAPFYAVAIYPGDVGTSGGLLTDEYARVLRDDGSIIEGLYATGNCTASVCGHRYPGAGASIAASLVFGYVSALHMCGAVDQLPSLMGQQ